LARKNSASWPALAKTKAAFSLNDDLAKLEFRGHDFLDSQATGPTGKH
jgi:hypothetical protein